ncbi:MAG TPA: tRNA (N(6)-L-threonylcarbamoyladenosine(37)-C(2))-methylthiotransferase MtaB [Clostridia bacterium]|nr:tRNA (N(6)-L-threonylcarbamoyladenosine(37)-C(2))-methylthiotransferase MtaB [Clostridia bacterium]
MAAFTLGCKVNQYETEAISGVFEKSGYQIVDFAEKADVYVINTCTVTSLSDRKSRQIIRRAKKNNEDSVIVVTGCYAQTASEEVAEIPGVDLIIGTKDRSEIINYIERFNDDRNQVNAVKDIMQTREFEDLGVDEYKGRTRAFLKIQEGCSQFCSYCIVPYARGPVRSRQPESIIDEVNRLAKKGFKEIVLTGIHIASYGKDIKMSSLIDIIKRVHIVEGIERIRLGSIEPTTINKEFIETAKTLGKLCPHYHISLQSGSDSTLRRMNRKYTTGEYKKVVEALRSNFADVAITTDVMVGFPGETEQEFQETFNFLEDISFAQMHVFKYSRRKGTPAASYDNQVSPEIKEERSNKLIEMSKRNVLAFNRRFEGSIAPVLFEQESSEFENHLEGLTSNYIRVIAKASDIHKGKILNVRLEKAVKDYALGSIEEL